MMKHESIALTTRDQALSLVKPRYKDLIPGSLGESIIARYIEVNGIYRGSFIIQDETSEVHPTWLRHRAPDTS